MTVWAIVLAGGQGRRSGGHKQFVDVGGGARPADLAVQAVTTVAGHVVVVLPAGVRWDGSPQAVPVVGGTDRAGSVRAGLAAVPAPASVVLLHDAAHPLASPALCTAVVEAVRAGADVAVPVVPVVESALRVAAGRVVAQLDRADLVCDQMPQAFRAAALRAAYARPGRPEDDVAAALAAGLHVRTVPGEVGNVHVTDAAGLALVTAVRAGRGRVRGGGRPQDG